MFYVKGGQLNSQCISIIAKLSNSKKRLITCISDKCSGNIFDFTSDKSGSHPPDSSLLLANFNFIFQDFISNIEPPVWLCFWLDNSQTENGEKWEIELENKTADFFFLHTQI